jgi:hypothetical protein
MEEKQMPDQKELIDFQYQKANKPMIEEVMPECLDREKRKAALDFIAWLRANKMKPAWSAWQIWKASYKGNVICTIRLPYPPCKDTWGITPIINHISKYEESVISEGLQNILLDNVVYCVYSSGQSGIGCSRNKPCFGGESRKILGKEIKYVCHDSPTDNLTRYIRFLDPNETTIDGIKRLLKKKKKAREENSECGNVPLFERTEKSLSLYKEYKTVDPKSKIEDVAAEFLEGEKLKNALDLIAWLRANNISINLRVRVSEIAWNAEFKGKIVCVIYMGESNFVTGSWNIHPNHDVFTDDSLLSDENLKEIVWANIKTCKNCSNCGLGPPRIIFGKEFENTCGAFFGLWNPCIEEIDCAKKLISAEIRRL